MLGGAYSTQFKNIERQHVDTIKTLAENEKSDAIARARKLSVETNRRRRALAIKRKSEAEREEKRRRQILAKRREKQQEATEKFQRGHIQSRPSSGSSYGRWSPRRTNINTQLEDALKIVRGSPVSSRASSARTRNQSSPNTSYYRQNSDPLSKPYFNKYAHPSINNGQSVQLANNTHKQEELHNKSLRNLNNSRNLFEQQLESYQQSLLEQQQKTLREFNKQIMKEIEVDKNVVNNETNGVNELERSESLSTVDSLEDRDTNDTLRESCDLNAFMSQKNEINYFVNGAKNVTFAGDHNEAIKISGNNSHTVQSALNMEPQNIDSYSAQIQASQTPNQRTEEQKQQFYIQRQKEIQQQLQDQQQQQMLLQQKQQKELQQKELQQKVLEEQQKQQQLLQQQYERQKQEELEKRRQEQEYQQQQAAVSMATTTVVTGDTNSEGKENQRPKVQLKAWATPSPQPPPPTSTVVTTAQTYVTHASPYTGKNTHTNMTVPMVTPKDQSSKSVSPVSVNSQSNLPQTNSLSATHITDKKVQANSDMNKSEHTNPPRSAQDKSLSFLETVTYGISVTPDSKSTNSTPTTIPKSRSDTSVADVNSTQQVPKTNGNSGASTKPATMSTNVSKPPIHAGYYNSYGAAYSARQQLTNGSDNKQTVRETRNTVSQADTGKMNGEVTWGLPEELAGHLKMMTTEPIMNGDDAGDTDSVSTIYEDREPEPKEVKSILKRNGSGKKTGGILKKSCSTGNMKEIRDSLEITRVHLQTSAEEKEQRMLREKERLTNPPPTPTKKNVRFADLSYDAEPEQGEEGNSKLFVRRNNDSVSHKPPRPVSAVTTKTLSPKIDSKPPRASSASVRTSTIPRAKTQIVRPQATAHIITQSTQNLDNVNEKVSVVNSNFMEKVPAMARANQTALSVAPASVYAVNAASYTQPQQKVNYAVSSIVMPKSESAPFIYPGYTKQGPVPAGSVNGPSQGGNSSKYDGAVYDDNGLRIDRTPTDEEINFLWDKLRNCLSRNSQVTPDGAQADGQTMSSRQAAPVAHTYIDGNALGQFNSLNRVAQQPGLNNNPSLRRQNSLDSAPNSYTRRYGLLQQRKQQPNPNSLKARQQQQGYTVYQAPVQSHSEPQPAGPIVNGADVTESMAGFLAAEQLADQSVSESRLQQAMEEAQARQLAYNTGRPQPKVKSALSVEEQRLMESLDRLNDKLKTAEGTVPDTSPPSQAAQQQQQQPRQLAVHRSSFLTADGKVSGFKGHTPITQRRVIEAGNHRARLRITSAHLKRNIHRHQ